MSRLEIRLFGEFAVTDGGSRQSLQLPHGVQSLFAYLVLNRKVDHPRDDLLQIFWPEDDPGRARSRLNTALWRLRKAFSSGGVDPNRYIVARTSGEVAFDRESEYWLDVEVFEQDCTELLGTANGKTVVFDPTRLEHAVRLYQGDALRGFYDDWAVQERERLQDLHIRGLTRLMSHYQEQGAFAKAIDYGRTIVAHEPLREDAHRDMIRAYAALGQRAMALHQYKLCKSILETELGVAPMADTEAALRLALTGHVVGQPGGPPLTLPAARTMTRELRTILDKLERAAALLHEASVALAATEKGER
jgi:DNA-binding SARP family transcriptional activator